jgi:hypothetical protein
MSAGSVLNEVISKALADAGGMQMPLGQEEHSRPADAVLRPVRRAQRQAMPFDGPPQLLTNYQKLVARTVDAFGDELKASQWLSIPNPDLNGGRPTE